MGFDLETKTGHKSTFKHTVTHRPIIRQRQQHTRGQQYRSGVFCGPHGDRCYATRDSRGQQCRRGFSMGSKPKLYNESL
jgi:peptide methionine sulfoxide reductase MsrA